MGTRREYRRRGLLRQIITRAFAEQRERGQSVASLWASQAAIYQRYGFARAGMNREYAVDTVDIALMNESSQDTYSVIDIDRLNFGRHSRGIQNLYRQALAIYIAVSLYG